MKKTTLAAAVAASLLLASCGAKQDEVTPATGADKPIMQKVDLSPEVSTGTEATAPVVTEATGATAPAADMAAPAATGATAPAADMAAPATDVAAPAAAQ